MLTDLVQIRRLGEKMRPENERFRRHLKTHDIPERKFRRIAEEIEDQIDCSICANCCRVATVDPAERDVAVLARYLRISEREFLARYTERSPEGTLLLKRTPNGCIFLDGNECSVYEVRPDTCRNFPHVVRGSGSIPSRMWQFIDRATYCPIVYNSLEAFKDETKFRK